MKAELMNRMQEILEEAVAAKELAGGSLLVRQHGEELCYLQAVFHEQACYGGSSHGAV